MTVNELIEQSDDALGMAVQLLNDGGNLSYVDTWLVVSQAASQLAQTRMFQEATSTSAGPGAVTRWLQVDTGA